MKSTLMGRNLSFQSTHFRYTVQSTRLRNTYSPLAPAANNCPIASSNTYSSTAFKGIKERKIMQVVEK